MPSVSAFCRNEPSDRFINFVSFDTGVLAFECAFNNLTSDAVYSFRLILFFVAFLATSILRLDSQQLDITSLLIRKRMDTNGGRQACGVEVRASKSQEATTIFWQNWWAIQLMARDGIQTRTVDERLMKLVMTESNQQLAPTKLAALRQGG